MFLYSKIFFPLWHLSKIYLWFFIIWIFYIYISSVFWCLSCLVFSELPGCVVWGLSLYAGSYFKSFLPSFLFFSSFPLTVSPSSPPSHFLLSLFLLFLLCTCLIVCSGFSVLGYFLLFMPASFLLIFSFRSFYSHRIDSILFYSQMLPLVISRQLISSSKALFISSIMFIMSSISFWFLLTISISLLALPIYSCPLCNLFIKALVKLIFLWWKFFNEWMMDNSAMWAM